MTPETYSQVRIRNGSNCAKSLIRAPVLAASSARPALKTVSSARAGRTSSQSQVTGSPVIGMSTNRTTIESAICCSSIIT